MQQTTQQEAGVASSLPPALLPVVMEGPPPAEYEVVERSLRLWMEKEVPIESVEELKKRERIMAELKRVFQQWVYEVCRRKGLSEDASRAAGGKLYTSGSYRLRVHEPGADIDSVGVAPKHCERSDFFSSLKEALLEHPDVENLRSIETAAVPIMTFDMESVNVDLLFATLPMNGVPESTDIDDDNILRAVDSSTEKSLNGPRVTNLIYKLVSHNYESFLAVLRVTRIWAKKRGIYSNKHGYLGGVNFNILVGIVCQLFPRATPAFLLEKFFELFANWNWETTPAMLCRPVVHKTLDFEVWGQTHLMSRTAQMVFKRNNIMPIVTPAYPAMNSAANVNAFTFDILRGEFERAHAICKDIIGQHKKYTTKVVPLAKFAKTWAKLVEKTNFFSIYDSYLAVRILGPKSDASTKVIHDHLNDELNDEDSPDNEMATSSVFTKKQSPSSTFEAFEDFSGFVSSRLRKLVERLGNLPFGVVHLLPKEFEDDDPDPTKSACRFYVGVDPDETRLKEGEAMVLTHVWTQFWRDDICRNNTQIPPETFDIKLEYLKWKDLPLDVFENDEKIKADLKKKRRKRRRLLRQQQQQQTGLLDEALASGGATQAGDDIIVERKKNEANLAPAEIGGPLDDADASAQAAAEKRRRLDIIVDDLDDDDLEPPLYSLDNLPPNVPRLGPVLPKWHPLARDSRYPVKAIQITLFKVLPLPDDDKAKIQQIKQEVTTTDDPLLPAVPDMPKPLVVDLPNGVPDRPNGVPPQPGLSSLLAA